MTSSAYSWSKHRNIAEHNVELSHRCMLPDPGHFCRLLLNVDRTSFHAEAYHDIARRHLHYYFLVGLYEDAPTQFNLHLQLQLITTYLISF